VVAPDVPSQPSLRRAKPPNHQRREPAYAFSFLDETGTLGGRRDPFFGVGLLHCSEPYQLLRPIQRLRDCWQFYDEIKWNKVSTKSLPVLKEMASMLLNSEATFHAFIADKRAHDVIGRFGGQFRAYECLARQLVRGSIKRGEIVWLVADEYSTPPGHTFEENVRDYVNQRLKRTAVAGVCRLRSTGCDLLQMIDLILGAIVYEYKAQTGVVGLAAYKPKTQLLDHIKKEAGVATLVGDYRDARLNIVQYHG
jgi:hypothetical protein